MPFSGDKTQTMKLLKKHNFNYILMTVIVKVKSLSTPNFFMLCVLNPQEGDPGNKLV